MSFRSLGLFTGVAAIVMVVVVLLFESSCAQMPPDIPREEARAAVLAATTAAQVLDETCARAIRATRDVELAGRCKEAYSAARIAIISVAEGVDHWEDSPQYREDIICAAWTAATQIEAMARELAKRQLAVPPIAQDAKRLVTRLGVCHGS